MDIKVNEFNSANTLNNMMLTDRDISLEESSTSLKELKGLRNDSRVELEGGTKYYIWELRTYLKAMYRCEMEKEVL